jgi:hypothetical protein
MLEQLLTLAAIVAGIAAAGWIVDRALVQPYCRWLERRAAARYATIEAALARIGD